MENILNKYSLIALLSLCVLFVQAQEKKVNNYNLEFHIATGLNISRIYSIDDQVIQNTNGFDSSELSDTENGVGVNFGAYFSRKVYRPLSLRAGLRMETE